jgi:CRP/FNR family transcriptional regulator
MNQSATVDHEKLLKMYPALSELHADQLTALLRPESILQLPENTELFAEHQPCRGFPLVLEGSIRVIKQSANGRELMLYRVKPGGSCIISSSCLLGKTQYNARGITETAIKLLVLPVPLFSNLIIQNPAFRDFVFHLFSERIANLMELVEEVAFSRLDQRLAKQLLSRPDDVLSITHQQLANELGSVREIISRLLKGFATQGLLSLSREQITILDRKKLTELASM